MKEDGQRGLSPGYSKVYRNEKGQFNLICPNREREGGRERYAERMCPERGHNSHLWPGRDTHTHPHTWAARSPHAKGSKGGATAAEA